jgi:hypothetical protein
MTVTPHLKIIAAQSLSGVFAYYAEFLMAGTYNRGTDSGGPVPVSFLVMPVPSDLLPGGTVQPNDEQIFIQSDALASVTNPRPGDYIVENAGGLRRDVIAAHQDLAKTFWTIIARRVFN